MDALDFAAFRSAHLTQEPFPYLILPGFVKPDGAGRRQRRLPPHRPSAAAFPWKS